MTSNAIKVTDFAGHNLYVGIDTHHKSWAVSIYSDEFELKTFTQEPNVDQLVKHLQHNYPGGNYHVAYESGFCGYWIQRSFTQKGIDCQIIHAADVPSSDKESKRKTDRVDCRKIARGLKNGDLNAIYVPDETLEADRMLVRTRGRVVKDLSAVKNRIKAFLKIQGIVIPDTFKTDSWTIKLIEWLRRLELKEQSNKAALSIILEELLFLITKEKQLQTELKALSLTDRYKQNAALLMSVPSIGLIASMTLLTELVDINRFKSIDHLCSYCGLTPNTHSSGATERITGLSRRGNPFIKIILVECAWMALRKDPALLLYYKQLIPRMNANKAIIKVTRKLLNRIRYVLKTKSEYVKGVVG